LFPAGLFDAHDFMKINNRLQKPKPTTGHPPIISINLTDGGKTNLSLLGKSLDLSPENTASLIKALAASQSLSVSLRHRGTSVAFGAWYFVNM
jgi:hypothetical protein